MFQECSLLTSRQNSVYKPTDKFIICSNMGYHEELPQDHSLGVSLPPPKLVPPFESTSSLHKLDPISLPPYLPSLEPSSFFCPSSTHNTYSVPPPPFRLPLSPTLLPLMQPPPIRASSSSPPSMHAAPSLSPLLPSSSSPPPSSPPLSSSMVTSSLSSPVASSPLSSCPWQPPTRNLNHAARTDLSVACSSTANDAQSSSTSDGSSAHAPLPLLAFTCPSLVTSPVASPRQQPSSLAYSVPWSPSGPLSPSAASKEGIEKQGSFTFSIEELSGSVDKSGRVSHADELFENGKLLSSSAPSISIYAEIPVLQKIQIHEAQVSEPRITKSHMEAHSYRAPKSSSPTSKLFPPKVFHIEERELAYPNLKEHHIIEEPPPFLEASPLSHNARTHRSYVSASPPLLCRRLLTPHTLSPQNKAYATSFATKKASHTTEAYEYLGCNKDPMYSLHRHQTFARVALLATQEQMTMKEFLQEKSPKKVHSSSFFKKFKAKFSFMVGARSRNLKLKKEQDFSFQVDDKLSDYRGHGEPSCIINKPACTTLKRDNFKTLHVQRKATRRVHSVSSPHAHHYINQRAEVERLKKKTFLPYHAHLLSCLGFSR
ncbi:hypothetical protein L7F22_053708 [Adiantum nelumboides]|nr:hypothetical protein [Adiantum nelumboides]